MKSILKWTGATSLAVGISSAAGAQVTEIRVGYQPSPIQEQAVAILERWGAKNNVKITKVPNAYGVYVEKMTASLTSGSDQYDLIWHNDDWGQLWAHLVEPVDDVENLKYADPWGLSPIVFNNKEGKITTVPMGHTMGTFFYRKDLVNENEVPKTWDELVSVSKKLQADNKVRFGYVGAMAMNATWFTWLWSMWTNNCDVLLPAFERDNAKLAANGFKSGLTEPCATEAVTFWWDNINTHKISPRGMPSYDRNEANAIFTSGEAAFTVADSVYYGTFNDPQKSKVAGKVGIGYLPLGPRRKEQQAWNDIWGWAIPKSIPAERKALVKKMLNAMMADEEGQIELFKKTGAPPPNMQLWDKIAKDDPVMRDLKKYVMDVPNKVRGAYYFERWPAVHKAVSDAFIKAVTGKREDIAASLNASAPSITAAAQ
jgi:ABC-type glycerol-3-phosphate transport system substrate-binding protein